ncbi:DEAD/DEAH box helicase, partial [Reticulomyxa filosa]
NNNNNNNNNNNVAVAENRKDEKKLSSSSSWTNNGNRYLYRQKVCPRTVILSPSRELAMQTNEQAQKFVWKTGLRSAVLYGGGDLLQQLNEMRQDGCAIVVATPGRLYDLIRSGEVSMEAVEFCVLDEGDRMLDMGFLPQVQGIVREMPRKGSRQTVMLSATFPPNVQKLAQEFLHQHLFLAIGRVGSTHVFIRQKMVRVEDRDKLKHLIDLLTTCKGLCLIFVETRKNANNIENQLVREGFDAISLHGDRSQSEREHALSVFRSGKCPILVATDVAARGLDIPNVLWVFNYDLPKHIDAYVHRIGRTGRCGHTGNAISFVNDKDIPLLSRLLCLLKESKQEVPQWLIDMAVSCPHLDTWTSRHKFQSQMQSQLQSLPLQSQQQQYFYGQEYGYYPNYYSNHIFSHPLSERSTFGNRPFFNSGFTDQPRLTYQSREQNYERRPLKYGPMQMQTTHFLPRPKLESDN